MTSAKLTLLFSLVCGASLANAAQPTQDVVDIAVASKAHKTLVTAVKAAELVDDLKNSGPFTVFAPTDEAFSKLPPGTIESLIEPENKEKLKSILEYHVSVGVFTDALLTDGLKLDMADGATSTIKVTGGKISINGANVVGSVRGTNGIVHVIDAVLLPPE